MKLDSYALGVAPGRKRIRPHLPQKKKKNPQMKHFFLNVTCYAGYWDTDFGELSLLNKNDVN